MKTTSDFRYAAKTINNNEIWLGRLLVAIGCLLVALFIQSEYQIDHFMGTYWNAFTDYRFQYLVIFMSLVGLGNWLFSTTRVAIGRLKFQAECIVLSMFLCFLSVELVLRINRVDGDNASYIIRGVVVEKNYHDGDYFLTISSNDRFFNKLNQDQKKFKYIVTRNEYNYYELGADYEEEWILGSLGYFYRR